MTNEFMIDGVCYVVSFTENHELNFYADVRKSERVVYDRVEFSGGFWDDPPLRIWTKTDTGHVFAVKRKVLEFLEHALRRYSPYYFTFGAIEESRVPIYGKIAHRIGRKFGYDVTVDGGAFRFTRCES